MPLPDNLAIILLLENCDIDVSHKGLNFRVTVDVAFFPLDTTNFVPASVVEDGRNDKIASWYTWDSLFKASHASSVKYISKRGAATFWTAKQWKAAPKCINAWKKGNIMSFFMSGHATGGGGKSDEQEEEMEDTEDNTQGYRREDPTISQKYVNQLAFSIVRRENNLASDGDSGSAFRDQDNNLLGFQYCLIEGTTMAFLRSWWFLLQLSGPS